MTTLHDLQHLRTAEDHGDLSEYTRGLASLGINWPAPPTHEILFNLAGSEHIIRLYGHLDLRRVRWDLQTIPAATLAAAAVPWDEGLEAVAEVCSHLDFTIRNYREVWNGTWRVPPYLIDGALMNPPAEGLHLIEGHTRMGVLRGSLLRADITPHSLHCVWVASTSADDD
jgi:hypothetical protein